MKKDKQLVGAAGEHLVLSRLLSRGLLASPAPRGTRKASRPIGHGYNEYRVRTDAGEDYVVRKKDIRL